jgi:uncharacterized membrane protein YkoI
MMSKRSYRTASLLGTAAAVLGTSALAALTTAQAQDPANQANPAVAPQASGNRDASRVSLAEIERQAISQGIRITEIEVQDRVVEVEGRDSSNQPVELLVDAHTGEILSRKHED